MENLLNPTAENLVTATAALEVAHTALAGALNAEADARFALDTARADALIAGVDGKNEAARSAALDLQLASERQPAHAAEKVTREARAALAIAEARLTALRYQIRLLEVTK